MGQKIAEEVAIFRYRFFWGERGEDVLVSLSHCYEFAGKQKHCTELFCTFCLVFVTTCLRGVITSFGAILLKLLNEYIQRKMNRLIDG